MSTDGARPTPHRGLAAIDIVIAGLGIPAAITTLRGIDYATFSAPAQVITAILMLVSTVLLLIAGLLLLLGCTRLCVIGAGACLGAVPCFVIAQMVTFRGTGPGLALMSCLMIALALLTAIIALRDLRPAEQSEPKDKSN